MAEALSDKTIEIVKSTVAALEAGGTAITDYDECGLITGSWLAHNTPIEEAAYFLCGPRPFLCGMVGGVALNRIRYEFFGPADELLAA